MSDEVTEETPQIEESDNPTYEELAAQLSQARYTNQIVIEEMRKLNRGIAPTDVLLTRLQLLIDMILPEEDISRMAFELNFENSMLPQLEAIVKQARIEMLTAGVSQSVPDSISALRIKK